MVDPAPDFGAATARHGAGPQWSAEVPADWSQGRTAFGGLTAALATSAVLDLPELSGRPVRSVDVAFVAPVPPGEVGVHAELLRAGRYLAHAVGEVRAPSAGVAAPLLTRVHVVLGSLRPSDVVVAPREPHPVPRDECVELPFLPGLTPEFSRHFDFRFASAFPFTGSSEATMRGWCRHRGPARGVPALMALVDAWPGTVLPVLTQPAPASTVRWSMQFPDDADVTGDGWFWYEAETAVAAGGYSVINAHLWASDGRLVAWTEQMLAVFDRRVPR